MMQPREQKVARITAVIQRELSRDSPVIIGPWTGEVGYEVLYWIPFVRWVLRTFQVPPERVIVVSRGGTASWYSGIGVGQYVDAFDLISPEELAARGGAKPKQSGWSDAGGVELLNRVRQACNLTDTAHLVPHWMYRLYRYYWDGEATIDFVEEHAVWARVAPPVVPQLDALVPVGCVAVRFYFSRSFPETEANRRFARELIRVIAASRPVVLLNHPFTLDDHRDFEPVPGSVSSVADVMTPSTNLAVQTAVIGRAAAFVGTYGGLSLLPPLCGVPSYSFNSVSFMKAAHQQAIARMIDRAEGAPLHVGDVTDPVGQADALLSHIGAR
jgi:hypothetical protein